MKMDDGDKIRAMKHKTIIFGRSILVFIVICSSCLFLPGIFAMSFKPLSIHRAESCDWPMDRGNSERTGTSKNGPVTTKQELLWKKENLVLSVVCSDKIYAKNKSKLLCLDKDMNELWKFDCLQAIGTIAAADNKVIFESSCQGKFYCLDAQTGNSIWIIDKFVDDFVVADNAIYIHSSISALSNRFKIEKLDFADGQTVWSSNEYDFGYCLSYSEGKLYFESGSEAVCISADNGQELWKYKANKPLVGYMLSSKVRIFFCNQDGYIYCLGKTSGNLVWQTNFYSDNSGIVNVLGSSMAFSNDKLFVCAQNGMLFCFDANKGKLLWSHQAEGNIENTSPVVSNGKVFFVSGGSMLYCISEDNGKLYWKHNLDYSQLTNIVPGNNKIYVNLPNNNTAYCFVDSKNSSAKEVKIVFQMNSKTYYVNDEKNTMDVEPLVIQGRTFIPVRYLAEPLGCAVEYDIIKKQITLNNCSRKIILTIGSNLAEVDGKMYYIDVDNKSIVPVIKNGRTMIPIRFVSGSFDCKVEWKPDTKEITVTYAP